MSGGRARSRVRLHAFADAAAWGLAAARDIAEGLRVALAHDTRATLLVSGGSTPAPVFHALAHQPLEWDRVDVGLVDDRWVPADDPGSNARLVRESLLVDRAAAARFQLLVQCTDTIGADVDEANRQPLENLAVVLLGMGDDGHTASLFPGMRDLDAALHADHSYVAVDATDCPGAGQWARRISLTPVGLAPARKRILLLRGAEKRAVFEHALDGEDVRQYPVRIAFMTPGAPLDVYWAP